MAAATPINLCSVLSESKRIINPHSRHFLALSVLFLLPLSFALTVYPYVQQLLFSPDASQDAVSLLSVTLVDQPATLPTGLFLLTLGYSVFVSAFSLLAIGSITYSVFQGFYGRPVKLVPAIKSGFKSFLPLFVTLVVADVIVSAVVVIVGLLLFCSVKGVELAGLEIEYSSPYFLAICGVIAVVVFLILMNMQVNWNLAWVIAVVESKCGYLSLRRSKNLVSGMKSVSLSIIIFFGLASMVLLYSSNSASAARLAEANKDSDTVWWMDFAFVFQIVAGSAFMTLLMLYNFAANTVLYMYCKAVHGELAWEIAEEFARDYVSLPFDDGKVPHIVSVAYSA